MMMEYRTGHPGFATTPRSPLRTRSRIGTIASQDGTELNFCCNRNNRTRETHLSGLGLSLGELRTKQFAARITPPSLASSLYSGIETQQIRHSFLRRDRLDTEAVKYEMVQLAGDATGRVQVDNLGDLGFTTEDLSRVIYDKFKDEDLPDFLDYVALERKGGLDRVGEIWYPEKYLWFAFLIGSMILNTTYLILMDWAIFQSFTTDTFKRFEGVDFTNVTQAYSRLVESSDQTADIFKTISEPETRWMLLNLAAIVATWEMSWILLKFIHTLIIWWRFFLSRSEYKSFHAVVYFFQKLLPQFSTFSAIKLMAQVHPSLIYNEYLYFVNESSLRGTRWGIVFVSVFFFTKCSACALAAMGAFAIKLLAVSLKLMNPSYSVLYRLGSVAALMNQCMGCVLMEIVLQDRIFLFVFGGQDAMYRDREHAYKNVYECRVAKQIWQDFWRRGRRLQAIVLLATFDHYDLQKLLIVRLEDGGVDVKVGGVSLGSIDEVPQEMEAERTLSDTLVSALEDLEAQEPDSISRFCVENKQTPRSARRKSLLDSNLSKRDLFIVCPEDRNEDRIEDGSFEVASRCDSRGSVGSMGMGAVTRCLQNETEWRDGVF